MGNNKSFAPENMLGSSRRTRKRFARPCSAILAACLLLVAATWIENTAINAQDKRLAAKPQPLPFSHKVHTQFIPSCQDCHQIASDGWTMTFPPEEKCITCHAAVKADSPAIKKLAEYAAKKKPVPWVPVYVLADYVYFSHRTHVNRAKLQCEACHGPVQERDVLTREKPNTMATCISCHKENGAPTGCRTCHDTI
jgi:hypothetical protein